MSTPKIFSSKLYLKGKGFHRLSQLETKENKNFIITVIGKRYNLTKEEAFLLSPKAYYSILQSSLPFEISPSSDQTKKSKALILKCFGDLIQLFSTITQIKISSSNVEAFKYLNNYLCNPFLKNICLKVTPNKSQLFSFTSKMFLFCDEEILKSLNDFDIFINGKTLSFNKHFICCLTDIIFQLVLKDNTLTYYRFETSSFNDHIIFLTSILSGTVIESADYLDEKLILCFNILGCTSLFECFNTEDFDKLVFLLSFSNCSTKGFI
jgi:hypothetical protein